MSEYDEQYNNANYVAPLGLARGVLNWAGAIASIALVVGLVYWVFQLGTRNPNEIPIIRAMEGPARTQPDNPGGTQANHQGLAVNAVQSEGAVEKPAETVVLAPQQQSLTAEDLAQSELAKIQPVLRPKDVKPAVETDEQSKSAKQPEVEEDIAAEIIAAVEAETNTKATTAAPAEPTIQDPTLITETIVTEQQSIVISSSKYAPLKSPIPQSRPNGLNNSIQDATAVASQPVVNENDITSVPVGTRLVQLGAYDSREIAKSEWDKLIGKHGDLLTDKKQLIQPATSGGRKFYRLRAVGFETVEDSRNLCSALLARGTPCIPVSAR